MCYCVQMRTDPKGPEASLLRQRKHKVMRQFQLPDDLLPVWPENSIRRIPSSNKGYISVRNFGICESASVPKTPRIKQETPQSWTRRIPPARQPFMTDTSVAALMTDTSVPAVHDYAA